MNESNPWVWIAVVLALLLIGAIGIWAAWDSFA